MSAAARAQTIAAIRRALGRGGDAGAAARDAAGTRVAAYLDAKRSRIPARAAGDLEQRIALFTAQAQAVQAEVARLDDWSALPAAIATYLRRHNLPLRMVIARDPALQAITWPGGAWTTRTGRAAADDVVGLTTALAAIAETGTLLLHSSAERPTSLAFLPETSIVALPSARVLRAYEDGMALLLEEEGRLPRSLNFITGPSRSGDIEQTLQLGAHGPRRLLVLLIDAPVAAHGA